MSSPTQLLIRTCMARAVATRWVQSCAQVEYRFSIYGFKNRTEARQLASVLRSWRDGRARVAGLEGVGDLGVRDNGDNVEIWSSDSARLRRLAAWLEGRGLETTFIW